MTLQILATALSPTWSLRASQMIGPDAGLANLTTPVLGIVESLPVNRLSCHPLSLLPLLAALAAQAGALQSLWGRAHGLLDLRLSGWVSEEREVFGGIVARVEFALPPGVDRRGLVSRVWAEFERVDRVANPFDPASEVGRLNAAWKVGRVSLSSEMAEILDLSLWAFRATQGAFDPTVWPLKRLWKEAEVSGRWPSDAEVAAVLRRVGAQRIRLESDPPRATFEVPDMALDFGGIAKGWAVDRVALLLEAAGVRSYLVQCGGEVSVLGESPRGGPWAVGVRHPLEPGRVVGVVSGPQRLSVSTSGPTEQPLRIGGRFVHHVIVPSTGQPAPMTVLGVTVVIRAGGPKAARADALATALAVLGPRRGLEILARIPGADALFLVPGPGGTLSSVRSPGLEEVYRDLE